MIRALPLWLALLAAPAAQAQAPSPQSAAPQPAAPQVTAPAAPVAAPAPAPAVAPQLTVKRPDEPPPTLMFDPELVRTVNSIRQGMVARGASTSELAALLPNITLGAVLTYAPGEWSIWVNGQRYQPGQRGPDFEITHVGEDFVEFSMAGGARKVRLLPNQSFRAATGDVVEGRP